MPVFSGTGKSPVWLGNDTDARIVIRPAYIHASIRASVIDNDKLIIGERLGQDGIYRFGHIFFDVKYRHDNGD